jgi:AmpD protein
MPLVFDGAGLAAGIPYIASPHRDARPAGAAIELLVIHNISLPPGEFRGNGIVELFTGTLRPDAHPYYRAIAGLKVSSHFLIRRDGAMMQFVPCTERAWHAGASTWRGKSACNDFSIGIELEGTDETPFAPAQYDALAEVTAALLACYPIVDIVGHSDIAPQRKTDPGPCFDWSRYRTLLRRG